MTPLVARAGRALALALAALAAVGARSRDEAATPTARPPALPPIVFVSRRATANGELPGLGPHQRALAPGGRLLLRLPDGRWRALLPAGAMWDCSRPAPAPDGNRVAFAGTTGADRAWRIWIVNLDGSGLRQITPDVRGFVAPADSARFDDLEPCWVGDHTLCFASTRFPQRAAYDGAPVTNLHLIQDDGSRLRRITAERNGADHPAWDPRRGAIVYSRWWFNRWRASARDPRGITEDPALALPRDSINTWQLVEIRPNDHAPRLAAGALGARLDAMGAQPAIALDGTWWATYALNLGLAPRPGATGIERLSPRGGPTRRMLGAIVPESGLDPYRGTLGLAAPSACAPAPLPEGGVVFGYDPGARGDYGLWVAYAPDWAPAPLLDLSGTLELDPAPVVRRERGDAWAHDPGISPATEEALARGDFADPAVPRFTFEDRDVFASGGLVGAPRRELGLRLRFFAAHPRSDRAAGDTAVLVREAPVGARGQVRVTGLPAATPMFELLVRADGSPVVGPHGPAQVPGWNAGSAGAVTRCIGCHTGHSRLPAP